MRAPPLSFRPMTGAPTFIAMSMIFTILSALVSESDPPRTVKSCAKHEDQPAFDAAVAGDEAVAEDLLVRHAEVGAAMGDELVGLFEGAFIEQELDALARRHLALFVLAFAALGAASGFRKFVAPLQLRQLLLKVHGRDYSG